MTDFHREEIAKLEALYASNPGGRVFVHLAEALRKAGEHERARGILTEGLARHGDSASGYVVYGRVLLDAGEHDAAQRAFGRVLELDPGNLVALRGMAELAVRRGRPGEAARHYAELLSRNPFDDEIRDLLREVEALAAAQAVSGPVSATAAEGPVTQAAQERLRAVWPTPEAEPAGAAAEEEAVPSEAEAPYSAAPGETGEAVAAEPEFGLIDMEEVTGDLPAARGSAFMMAEDEDAGPEPDASDLFEVPADASLPDVRLEGGFAADGVEYAEFDIELELARAAAEERESEVAEPGAGGDLDLEAVGRDRGREEAVGPEAEPTAAELLAAEVRHWGRRGETPDADAGLVTETMADLYLSQGFHERAAEVYRALLERRPHDATLTAKLETAEGARHGVPAEAGEDWMRGSAWTPTETAGAAPTPYAWTDAEADEAEAALARPIQEYLHELLSWRAGGTAVAGPDTVEAAEERELAPGYDGSAAAAPPDAASERPDAVSWEVAGAAAAEADAPRETGQAADEEWTAEIESVAPDEIEPAEDVGVATESASAETAPEPWSPDEAPAPEAEAAAPAADEPWAEAPQQDASEPAGSEPALSDPWMDESAPPESEPWAQTADAEPVLDLTEAVGTPPRRDPNAMDTAFDEWYGGEGRPASDAMPDAMPDAAAEAQARQRQEEEDEDLAMFRAWLQSLKK